MSEAQRHRIFPVSRLQHDYGSLSSPEDDHHSRSQQVTSFQPLSDRSLIVLAAEIEDLKAHIEDINKQHVDEVGQLITENKHLQEHIRKIQDELERSRQLSMLQPPSQEDRLQELERHVRNLEAEIARREQRELLLIQQTDSLTAQLTLLQEECERYRGQSLQPSRQFTEMDSQSKVASEGAYQRLAECEKDRLCLEGELHILNRTVQALRGEKEHLERDVECLLDLRNGD